MRFAALFALVATVALAGPAQAATFTDIDALGGERLSARGDSSISGTFDITAAGIEDDSFLLWLPGNFLPTTLEDEGGFEVGTHRTVGASVLLGVRDDFDWRREYMLVQLDDVSAAGPIEVDFGIESIDVSATLYATIDGTGQLDYEIIAQRGDFRVDFAALIVDAEARGLEGSGGPAIPEVSSFAAYGVGTLLVAGAAARRRRED